MHRADSSAATGWPSNPPPDDPAVAYLDLLKKILVRVGFEERYQPLDARTSRLRSLVHQAARRVLIPRGLDIVRIADTTHDPEGRAEGRDRPAGADTMIGLRRLDNLEYCIGEVLRDEVPGDLLEAGVWRGGATIFMRAVLKAKGDHSRCVWVADSFQGLPRPDVKSYPADAGDTHWRAAGLGVSLDEVKANFRKYGLLDEQVRFLPGWFHETLPNAPVTSLSVLRLDGDMYESTIVSLEALYPKVSDGGFVIVDDYGAVRGCREAVDTYRREHGITEELHEIDWTGVYWRRGATKD